MGIVTTSGIFLINKDGKLLVAHPTGHDFDFWSVPKGKIDEGENAWEAALRETWEETNVYLNDKVNIRTTLPPITYKNKRKTIVPFIVFEDENPLIDSSEFLFRCNSLVGMDSKWNAGLPEMDGWRWVTLKEAKTILHATQVEVVEQINKLIKQKKDGEKQSQEQQS